MAIFFDPARRVNGQRIFSVEKYISPLSIVTQWLADFPAIGVSVSPVVKKREIAVYDADIEFISLRGELKETVLWFGGFKTGVRRATVLPGSHVMDDDGTPLETEGRISKPMRFFYESDSAVIRARMVQNLMVDLDAAQVDREIAYLTADTKKSTPFARVWEVETWFPFQRKRLRVYLRERHVGLLTVKKRVAPILPEELIQALRLPKDTSKERVVFLTHLKGRPIVVVCYATRTIP